MVMKTGDLAYALREFPFPGAIDADGHVAEPATLWEEYVEAKYKPRTIRLKRDANGLEYLESDGRPNPLTDKGRTAYFHGMGEKEWRCGPDKTYMGSVPYGASNAAERVDMMERENLEKALLYPTLSLCWEMVTPDPELTIANLRAYNRWIADFCRPHRDRLVPIAQLSLLNVDASVAELERAVKDGCKGAFLTLGSPARKPHAHPDRDSLFAKCQELDVPLAIHVSYQPAEYLVSRWHFDPWSPENNFYALAILYQGLQQVLLSFYHYNTFEKFPRLRLGILEGGSGWIGAFLDRLDGLYDNPMMRPSGMHARPSEVFRRQCFISGDPDEMSGIYMMKYVGAECFIWATDFPHPDHTESWVPELIEMCERVDEQTRRLVIGENVKRIYNL